ncbi:hypothetical protein AB4148_00125 [Vibrio sp. 10N.286.51.F4]|uniref:hypothetical protein n=1 Tax=Vibrio sp. 10N.286.51.F4 TaxID=3229710 RepID=UPI00354BB87B
MISEFNPTKIVEKYSTNLIEELQEEEGNALFLHNEIFEEIPKEIINSASRFNRIFLQECSKLSSLEGIDSFVNLELLIIHGCHKITSLKILDKLDKLKELGIDYQHFEIISNEKAAILNRIEKIYSCKKTINSVSRLNKNIKSIDICFSGKKSM